MLVNLLVIFSGIVVFLFIFWKRLREDYSPAIIFEAASYILLGIGVSQLVSLRFFPTWFLWAAFLGSAVGLYFGILRFKLRFYEALEALVIALLPWTSFVFLKDSVLNSSLSSFLAFLSTLFIIFVFYYVDTHYREFTWYRSGKVGFAGLTTLTVVFIVRSAIALLGINVLTFLGIYEVAFSAIAALFCFILIYSLAKKIE